MVAGRYPRFIGPKYGFPLFFGPIHIFVSLTETSYSICFNKWGVFSAQPVGATFFFGEFVG